MLDMELRYSGKPVTEDDIESTYYVCIVSGGNYSVRVVSQELR